MLAMPCLGSARRGEASKRTHVKREVLHQHPRIHVVALIAIGTGPSLSGRESNEVANELTIEGTCQSPLRGVNNPRLLYQSPDVVPPNID